MLEAREGKPETWNHRTALVGAWKRLSANYLRALRELKPIVA